MSHLLRGTPSSTTPSGLTTSSTLSSTPGLTDLSMASGLSSLGLVAGESVAPEVALQPFQTESSGQSSIESASTPVLADLSTHFDWKFRNFSHALPVVRTPYLSQLFAPSAISRVSGSGIHLRDLVVGAEDQLRQNPILIGIILLGINYLLGSPLPLNSEEGMLPFVFMGVQPKKPTKKDGEAFDKFISGLRFTSADLYNSFEDARIAKADLVPRLRRILLENASEAYPNFFAKLAHLKERLDFWAGDAIRLRGQVLRDSDGLNTDAQPTYHQVQFLYAGAQRSTAEATFEELLAKIETVGMERRQSHELAQARARPEWKEFLSFWGISEKDAFNLNTLAASSYEELREFERRLQFLKTVFETVKAFIQDARYLTLALSFAVRNFSSGVKKIEVPNPEGGVMEVYPPYETYLSNFLRDCINASCDIAATMLVSEVTGSPVKPPLRSVSIPKPFRDAVTDLLRAHLLKENIGESPVPVTFEAFTGKLDELGRGMALFRTYAATLPANSRSAVLEKEMLALAKAKGDIFEFLKSKSPEGGAILISEERATAAVSREVESSTRPVAQGLRKIYAMGAPRFLDFMTRMRGSHRLYSEENDSKIAGALARLFFNIPPLGSKYSAEWYDHLQNPVKRRSLFANMESDLRALALELGGEEFLEAALVDFKIFQETELKVSDMTEVEYRNFSAMDLGGKGSYNQLISRFFGGLVLAGNKRNAGMEKFIRAYGFLVQQAPQLLEKFGLREFIDQMILKNDFSEAATLATFKARFSRALGYLDHQQSQGYPDFLPNEHSIAGKAHESLMEIYRILTGDSLELREVSTAAALGGPQSGGAFVLGTGRAEDAMVLASEPTVVEAAAPAVLDIRVGREGAILAREREAVLFDANEKALNDHAVGQAVERDLGFIKDSKYWILQFAKMVLDPVKALRPGRMVSVGENAYAGTLTQDNIPGRLRKGSLTANGAWTRTAMTVAPGPKEFNHDAAAILQVHTPWAGIGAWDQITFASDGAGGHFEYSATHEPAMASKVTTEAAWRYLHSQLGQDPVEARSDLAKKYQKLDPNQRPSLEIFLREQLLSEAAKVSHATNTASPYRKSGATLTMQWVYQAWNGKTYATMAYSGDSKVGLYRRNAQGVWEQHSATAGLKFELDTLVGLHERATDSLRPVKVTVLTVEVQEGDVLLQISDGVSDNVTDAQVLQLLQSYPSDSVEPNQFRDDLLRMATGAMGIYLDHLPGLNAAARAVESQIQGEQLLTLVKSRQRTVKVPIEDREGYEVDAGGVVYRNGVKIYQVDESGLVSRLPGKSKKDPVPRKIDDEAATAYAEAKGILAERLPISLTAPSLAGVREDAGDKVHVPITWIDGQVAELNRRRRVIRDGEVIGRVKPDNVTAGVTVIRTQKALSETQP